MRVLVIPEDFRKDQYILKPIVEAMFQSLGVRSTVRVLTDPLLGGVDVAMNWDRLQPVIERYRGMTDAFLLCVDRDGIETRRLRLDTLEERAREIIPATKLFLAENAWQELEVWVLAGLNLPDQWSWREVRTEPHPKERYFQEIASARGVTKGPGEGRRTLGVEAAGRYRRICQLCPEDVGTMERRIRNWIDNGRT